MTDRICLESTEGHTIGHIDTVADHAMFYEPRLTTLEMRALLFVMQGHHLDANGALTHKLTTLLNHTTKPSENPCPT